MYNLIVMSPQVITVDASPASPLWKILLGRIKIELIKRGGRPRGPSKIRIGKDKISRKPEIVICKRERSWELFIEFPDDISGNVQIRVRQGSKILDREQFTNRWILKDITGNVEINQEGNFPFKFMMPLMEKHLLFKLNGGKLDHGRMVKSTSLGTYLVVAPENWHRDEVESGVAPIEPEPIIIGGYLAHYFFFEPDDVKNRIVFRDPDGRKKIIASKTSRFELTGNILKCHSNEISPLYGEFPPSLRALSFGIWEDVSAVVVGKEGTGEGKWRKELNPPEAQDVQDLAIDLEGKVDGWFFIRIYDHYKNLIESLDFHYISKLKKIIYSQTSPFPAPNGHQSLRVELFHDSDCTIFPANGCASKIPVECQRDKTVLTIGRDPSLTKSFWSIGKDRKVVFPILAERIWWAFGQEDRVPEKWTDVTCRLLRADFRATSESALWIKLPRIRFLKKFLVGFKKNEAKPYNVKVNDEICSSPLRELEGCPEVFDVSAEQHLRVWIEDSDDSAIIGVLEIPILNCRYCDHSTRKKNDLVTHVVKYHLDEIIIEEINYENIKVHLKNVPHKIYKCSYCPKYISCNDLNNPTSSICYHQEKECKKAPRKSNEVGSPVKLQFSVVDNLYEIRKYVIKTLPHFYKCSLCFKYFSDPTMQEKIAHLVDVHSDSLYR
ncbi:MAG: hypothetical protein ACXAB4_02175 [Candidatus Hodarchaeales archaeon]